MLRMIAIADPLALSHQGVISDEGVPTTIVGA